MNGYGSTDREKNTSSYLDTPVRVSLEVCLVLFLLLFLVSLYLLVSEKKDSLDVTTEDVRLSVCIAVYRSFPRVCRC